MAREYENFEQEVRERTEGAEGWGISMSMSKKVRKNERGRGNVGKRREEHP
jgi:hypothetical protein